MLRDPTADERTIAQPPQCAALQPNAARYEIEASMGDIKDGLLAAQAPSNCGADSGEIPGGRERLASHASPSTCPKGADDDAYPIA